MEELEEQISRFQQLKAKWQKAKETTIIPFYEYTDSLISDNEEMLSSNDLRNDYIKMVKLYLFNSEFEKLHIPGGMDLNFILASSSTDNKIKYFIEYNNQLNDIEYWTKLSEVYQFQDYNPVPYEILKALFTHDGKGRENLMNEEEKEFFKTLPDQVSIFRAMSLKEFESGEFRFSWSMDKKISEKFKKRNKMLYKEEHVVHSLQVSKKDILAFLDSRKEKEIIYLHNNS